MSPDGGDARATITGVVAGEPMVDGGARLVDVELAVELVDGGTVTVQRRELVLDEHLDRFTVGREVQVTFDPADPSMLWIDWSADGPGSG